MAHFFIFFDKKDPIVVTIDTLVRILWLQFLLTVMG